MGKRSKQNRPRNGVSTSRGADIPKQGQHVQDGNRQTDPNQGGHYVLIGAVVVWFLGVSTNGVFNFFSHPAFQLYPFSISLELFIAWLAFKYAQKHCDRAWVFMLASALCSTIFVLTSTAVDHKIASQPIRNAARLAGVDLNSLNDKYPFGFLIFQRKGPQEWFGVANETDSLWNIAWDEVAINELPNKKLRVTLPVESVSTSKHHFNLSTLIMSYELENRVNFPQKLMPDNPCSLYFEVLDKNPRHPVYLIGFSDDPNR